MRNRERILDAARHLVASDGAAVSMDSVARTAGVAVGTLYRHFTTKQDLVAAVVTESLERIADLAERARDHVASGRAPGVELAELFRLIACEYATDRAVKAAAAALGVPAAAVSAAGALPVEDPAVDRASEAIADVLRAARRVGAVDAEVTVDDLVLLITQLPDSGGVAQERYTAIVLAGLGLR